MSIGLNIEVVAHCLTAAVPRTCAANLQWHLDAGTPVACGDSAYIMKRGDWSIEAMAVAREMPSIRAYRKKMKRIFIAACKAGYDMRPHGALFVPSPYTLSLGKLSQPEARLAIKMVVDRLRRAEVFCE